MLPTCDVQINTKTLRGERKEHHLCYYSLHAMFLI